MQRNQIQIKNIQILKVSLADFNDISTIERELNINSTSYEFYKNSINSKNIKNFKLTITSTLIGYLCYQHDPKDCDIISIGIKQKFQKLGLGKKLINFVKLKNFHNIYVEVSNKNINAINFYKSLNFVLTGIRKNYYKNKDDALMMKLKIK